MRLCDLTARCGKLGDGTYPARGGHFGGAKMSTLPTTFDQMVEQIDCDAVKLLIGNVTGIPRFEDMVRAHIASCPTCQELERSFESGAPTPEECQKARDMMPSYLDCTLQSSARDWFVGHVQTCPSGCFSIISYLERLQRLLSVARKANPGTGS